MKYINLNNRIATYTAIIDDEDYPIVSMYKWHPHFNGDKIYARGYVNGKQIYMHNFILNTRGIDHKNNNSLDNQRSNLRLATAAQQEANKLGRSKFGFKGVSFCKTTRTFRARITVNKKSIHLGRFQEIHDAAKAYNTAAKKYYKEFAQLNELD